MESSLTTDEDFTRKNGSRYRKIPTNASPPYQSKIGKDNPKGNSQSKKERKEKKQLTKGVNCNGTMYRTNVRPYNVRYRLSSVNRDSFEWLANRIS